MIGIGSQPTIDQIPGYRNGNGKGKNNPLQKSPYQHIQHIPYFGTVHPAQPDFFQTLLNKISRHRQNSHNGQHACDHCKITDHTDCPVFCFIPFIDRLVHKTGVEKGVPDKTDVGILYFLISPARILPVYFH